MSEQSGPEHRPRVSLFSPLRRNKSTLLGGSCTSSSNKVMDETKPEGFRASIKSPLDARPSSLDARLQPRTPGTEINSIMPREGTAILSVMPWHEKPKRVFDLARQGKIVPPIVGVAMCYLGVHVPISMHRKDTSTVTLIADIFVWLLFCIDFAREIVITMREKEAAGKAARRYNHWASNVQGLILLDLLSALPIELAWYFRQHQWYHFARGCRLLKIPRVVKRLSAEGTYYLALAVLQVVLFCLHILAVCTQMVSPVSDELGYSTAFYWVVYTVTSVGYGDTDVGNSDAMHYYASVLMLLGAVVSGVFVGKVADVLSRQDHTARDIDYKKQELRSLLEFYRIPTTIQVEALAWQAHVLKTQALEHHSAVIEGLPNSMQEQVSLAARRHILERLPPLSGVGDACLEDLSAGLFRTTMDPGEKIVNEGDPASDLYFVTHGELEVLQGDAKIGVLRSGDVVGEACAVYGTAHYYSAVATGFCDCLGIPGTLVVVCCVRHPQFLERLASMASEQVNTPTSINGGPRVFLTSSIPDSTRKIIMTAPILEAEAAYVKFTQNNTHRDSGGPSRAASPTHGEGRRVTVDDRRTTGDAGRRVSTVSGRKMGMRNGSSSPRNGLARLPERRLTCEVDDLGLHRASRRDTAHSSDSAGSWGLPFSWGSVGHEGFLSKEDPDDKQLSQEATSPRGRITEARDSQHQGVRVAVLQQHTQHLHDELHSLRSMMLEVLKGQDSILRAVGVHRNSETSLRDLRPQSAGIQITTNASEDSTETTPAPPRADPTVSPEGSAVQVLQGQVSPTGGPAGVSLFAGLRNNIKRHKSGVALTPTR
eukprot:Hpha_TRINITY_DN15229_c0_g6::TRINITY_DN15229_c0_g6_i1::g.65193::m.65193/K04905/KCNH2; potassium voltage-gated channel Eag-related subfamily H member 2